MGTGSSYIKAISLGMAAVLMLGGCSGNAGPQESREISEQEISDMAEETEAAETKVPQEAEADWSEYFDGMNGAAVLYDASAMRYTVFHRELAETRRSPCSTFKIVSSLIALECGIIDVNQSTRAWSGETFWNENWNHDIGFEEAFRASCVWYFREVTDEIGRERMQEALDQLSYGNCDISDWEGNLNTNNGNRALTGFWIESSLAISPKEQTEVMERIFGENSVYLEDTRERLKEVMLVQENADADTDKDATAATAAVAGRDITVYGKTGTGMAQGIVVDAWFTGFAERGEERVYFCVYLGQTDGKDVSSVAAREIAVRLVEEYLREWY